MKQVAFSFDILLRSLIQTGDWSGFSPTSAQIMDILTIPENAHKEDYYKQTCHNSAVT